MARKPTNAGAGVPVALRDIAVDGKHFSEGDPIEGVDEEELTKAVRLGSAGYPAAASAAVAAPEGGAAD